ncbi:hypothetical protein DLD82_17380 [Methanospirillum stamsii]|uniref:HEPN domain-containing protein n=1 Tax=Methanospirillum stamsii TaxID=1277351 RepID=A0A2V2MTF0_9EURY|nr:hypothetical protein DLD82_17380 [Methanospirillum stamsii]
MQLRSSFVNKPLKKHLNDCILKKFRKQPDKIHSLVAIAVKLDLLIPNSISATIQLLNAASISIRYPPDLEELFKTYSQERVYDIINRTEEVLDWILRQ